MLHLKREVLVEKYGKDNLINQIEIKLYSSKIVDIDSNTFNGLTKLKILWLNDNSIHVLGVKLFESLSNLKHLYLNNNKLEKIESNTFKKLTKLEILYLGENKIEEIDMSLFKSLLNLKELYLRNNRLKRIDSNTFKGLAKLEELYLFNNEIEEIDVRLFESLSNLKQLSLSRNNLKRIDFNTFKKLTKLETLYLSENRIEEIDVRLFESLLNLKVLFLYNNKLKEIDRKCFEPLKSMEVIEIYENDKLNAVSFINPSTKCYYHEYFVKKYGSVSEWNKFLLQFPEIAKEKQEKERQEKEAFARFKIAEENKIKANLEQENVNKTSSSISSDLSKIDKEFQDPYIGLFLNDRYKVTRKLGRGAYGSVYLVNDTKIDIRKVKEKAMKIMDQLDSVTENEIDLLCDINHDNIVRYFDHFHKKIGGEDQTFLITEYCENGDLKNKIEEAKRLDKNFTDKQLLDWITQSTNALKYLHSKKPDPIIHRDIKPENMLLSGRNEIKLGDLGISKIMEKTHASTHAGTKEYMSPEVFKAEFMDTNYYPNTDVWSLGCVLYELKFLTKAFPRGQRNNPPIPTKVSSSGLFKSILLKMFEKDCLVRITSRQLLAELENLSIV